ncbi:unnamed protein product, partial [marine sediment metagenome]
RTHLKDIVRAVSRRVDARIWDVMSDGRTGATNINFVTISGTWGGNDASENPIMDIMEAKQKIRSYSYNPEGGELYLNSITHKNLLNWLINIKGSSIPNWSSEKVKDGVVMHLLGLNTVISENVTSNFGAVAVSKEAVTWHTFMPMTAQPVTEVGIGVQLRCWEEGEATLVNPRAVCLLSGTGTT